MEGAFSPYKKITCPRQVIKKVGSREDKAMVFW
jgi:hypothetical protein